MPKLCDFAFSKHKIDGRPVEDEALDCTEDVQFSSAVGTPQWMAPEVLRGETYTTSADTWSFGVVVWEIKHRKRPYEGTSAYAVTFKVASEGLRPSDNELLPAFWRKLMDDCFAAEGENRPAFTDVVKRLIDEAPQRAPPSRAKPSAAVVATMAAPRAAAAAGAGAAVAAVDPAAAATAALVQTSKFTTICRCDVWVDSDRLLVLTANRSVTRMVSTPELGRKAAAIEESASSPPSSPSSSGDGTGGSWGTLGARGDTEAAVAPQRWEGGQISATATALAMVLDARVRSQTVFGTSC